jgi:hypothetical protein
VGDHSLVEVRDVIGEVAVDKLGLRTQRTQWHGHCALLSPLVEGNHYVINIVAVAGMVGEGRGCCDGWEEEFCGGAWMIFVVY